MLDNQLAEEARPGLIWLAYTVVATKSDSDVILCFELLSKT